MAESVSLRRVVAWVAATLCVAGLVLSAQTLYAPEQAEAASACRTAPFRDVPTTSQFCADIAWLKAQGITGGYSDGTFRSTAPISRQAMAAFLYRLKTNRTTAPRCTAAPFKDVPTSAPLCPYIAWLKGQGITSGYAGDTFRSTAPVSRQAMATFLFRMVHPALVPAACTTEPYSDVTVGSKFCDYIAWLKLQKITGGYSDGGFHPKAPVSRQAMAAFLHRVVEKKLLF